MKLLQLTSNKESFKHVIFKPGLNLVLADRTEKSSATDSRNGVGKTTLLQIIDYCLGGRILEGDSLYKLGGKEWEFTLDLEVSGHTLAITRSVDASEVDIVGDGTYTLGLTDKPDAGGVVIGPGEWSDWLGANCFGLPLRADRIPNAPAFRGLLRHFLRFRDDAYNSPFKTFGSQPPVQIQAENAFLLGLNWEYAVEWQRLKDRDKTLRALSGADVEELGQELAELQARRARETSQLHRLEDDIKEFRVLPEYREVESRANDAATEMRNITNQILITRREIDLYLEQASTEFTQADQASVETLFNEVGVVFPEGLRRTLDQTRDFHASVSANRRQYLESEIRRLNGIQDRRNQVLQGLEQRRRDDMRLLESHGALEDYAEMQKRLGALSASVTELSVRIESIQDIRRGKSALKAETLELAERVELDLEERRSSYDDVLSRFSEAFETLYGDEAFLLVDVGDAGYRYTVRVPREGSTGTGKVGIFAYDLAITEAWSARKAGCGFLAHDSVLFDGVDERQTASAMALAAGSADEYGYQYILTANSDDLTPGEMDRVGLDVAANLVIRLTDAEESGGLLGVRI